MKSSEEVEIWDCKSFKLVINELSELEEVEGMRVPASAVHSTVGKQEHTEAGCP